MFEQSKETLVKVNSTVQQLAPRKNPAFDRNLGVGQELIAGIAIGVLIGLITGIVALVLLKTANSGSIGQTTNIVSVVSQLLAIPTFWFGGPWVTTSLLELVPLEEIIDSYIVSVAVVFSILLGWPVLHWIIQLARDLGGKNGDDGGSNGDDTNA